MNLADDAVWWSGHLDAILTAGFKYGQQVCDSEEFSDAFIQVDQAKIAADSFGGDVQTHDCTEARAVHVIEVGQVKDDSLGLRNHGFDLGLQHRGVFGGQPAGALHDGRIFHGEGMQLQPVSGNIRGIR